MVYIPLTPWIKNGFVIKPILFDYNYKAGKDDFTSILVRVRVKVRVRNRIPKIAIFLEKSQKLRYALVLIELRSLLGLGFRLGLGFGFGFGSLGFGVRVRIGIILVYTTAWYRARRICITFIMDGLYQIFPNTQKTGMYQIFPNGGSIYYKCDNYNIQMTIVIESTSQANSVLTY